MRVNTKGLSYCIVHIMYSRVNQLGNAKKVNNLISCENLSKVKQSKLYKLTMNRAKIQLLCQ